MLGVVRAAALFHPRAREGAQARDGVVCVFYVVRNQHEQAGLGVPVLSGVARVQKGAIEQQEVRGGRGHIRSRKTPAIRSTLYELLHDT